MLAVVIANRKKGMTKSANKKYLCLLLVLGIVIVSSAWGPLYSFSSSQAKKKAPAATSSITKEELRQHVFFLASDELEGRALGTPGYAAAVKYAEKEFRQAGAQPIFKDAQGRSTFLQPVPFVKIFPKDRGLLKLTTSQGEFNFSGAKSYRFQAFREERFLGKALQVVFVGFAVEEPEAGWNDLAGLDVKDKVAVMLPGMPMRAGEPALPEKLHRLYSGSTGEIRRYRNLIEKGALAVIIPVDKQRAEGWDELNHSTDHIKIVYTGGDNSPRSIREHSRRRGSRVLVREDVTTALFLDQEYSPQTLKENGLKDYHTFQLQETTAQFLLGSRDEVFYSWNVVAVVPGSDPKLSGQYITVGAHLDHVPVRSGMIFNGADDNASGSAGVLEIAEAVAMHPPRRSVIFVLYTAEESGVCGSRFFVKECPVSLMDIKANINLDMIGRTATRQIETRSHYAYAAADICQEFEDIVRQVNGQPPLWPLVFQPQKAAPGVSDHLSYMVHGIPGVFFCSGPHADVHRPTDDADKIEYDKMEKISQLAYALTMELANRDIPPCEKK